MGTPAIQKEYTINQMDKVNILYFGNLLLPDRDAASQRTLGNAKALRELGYNVTFVGCKSDVPCDILSSSETFAGFDMYYFEEPKSYSGWLNYLIDYRFILPVIDKIKPSKIILYNHPAISTAKIINYAHKNRIKVYADCTEWYDPKGFSIHTLIKSLDTAYRMKSVNTMHDGIITISSFLQNYYKKKGVDTICVPPLIDLTDDKWALTDVVNNDKNVIKLAYVGNPGIGTKDKLGLIINCLNNISTRKGAPVIEFDVIGVTEQQYKDVFHEQVDSIPSFVKFMGKVPHRVALDRIKECDYTIFLRDHNLVCTAGFPTKFSESIACGTSVLTNSTSDLKLYLKDGFNGYTINEKSFDTLCDSVYNAVCVGKNKIKEMKDYCRAEMTFDYHSFVEEFKKMF